MKRLLDGLARLRAGRRHRARLRALPQIGKGLSDHLMRDLGLSRDKARLGPGEPLTFGRWEL